MHRIRYKIFSHIDQQRRISAKIYTFFLTVVVLLSVTPLIFIGNSPFFVTIDYFSTIIFIIDYLLRWFTADFQEKRKGWKPFLYYPVRLMAIIDLLSILPFFLELQISWQALRLLRTLKFLRLVRHSKSLRTLMRIFHRETSTLRVIFSTCVMFAFMSALLIFPVEHHAQPENFRNFFDALWWAFATLTTVGYGDIYPVTTLGRMISMFLSVVGIGLVALPSGIIAAGFLNEVQKGQDSKSA